MSEAIIQTLPYLAPPLLGAVIGYVTNYIAIRMLSDHCERGAFSASAFR